MIHQLKITGKYQVILSTCPTGSHILNTEMTLTKQSLIFALGNIIHNSFCFDRGFVLESSLNRHCSVFMSKKADEKPLLCSWSRMGYEVSSCGIFS